MAAGLITPRQPDRAERRDTSVEDLFGALSISSNKNAGEMLLYHWYTWQEGVPDDAMVMDQNMGLTRLSIDVLLPGPKTLEQIEVSITGKWLV